MIYNLNSKQVSPLIKVLQEGRYFDWLDENTIVCNALYHTTPTIDTFGFGTMDIRDPSKLNLLYDSDLHDIQPAISPDGKFIAFIGYFEPTGFHDVFIVNLETKKRTRLTETRSGQDTHERNPAWHSDGSSIFFERRCETFYCVWEVDVKRLERQKITQGDVEELWPSVADMDLFIYTAQK